MSAKDTINKFNDIGCKTEAGLSKNPFSDNYQQQQHSKSDERYGRPEAGSKTEKRGINAGVYVLREIAFLCEIIDKYSDITTADGCKAIKFGPLFGIYSSYSDKLVGMLLRARKHGLVHFEGEMLYQRQDDHKIVTLLKPIDKIKNGLKSSGDPAHCLKFEDT